MAPAAHRYGISAVARQIATREARWPLVLLASFIVIWTALAIRPWYPQDWWLENLLVIVTVPLLVGTFRRLRFSDAAYGCLWVFFVLHVIGAHYTYSEVPYEQWWRNLTGESLNALLGFERNHYDRLVHFMYGLLILVPARELLAVVAPPRGVWRIILPITFIMSHSVLYELIEWAAALVFGGPLGQAYLGTQGDVWDAQKDSGLATLGAVIGTAIVEAWPFERAPDG
jgi:putative membrane protein